ncbi:MAG: metallophosphoesterase family protein [Alistipes sp.]|nr:metallophosphoesterase family protein [Alistipes sp.]
MKILNKLFLATALMLICAATAIAQPNALKFNANHKFKIVQFTDIHWKYGNPASDEAGERMAEVLDAEKPDLVVFTGDVIFAKPAREGLDKALEATISRGIPFAVTWGNHDDEQDLSRKELSEHIATKAGNLTSTVEGISGVTNYTLSVKSTDGKRDAAVLYIFDSNSYSPIKKVKGYDWIKHDQVEWYRQTSKAFTAANNGKPLPALAFFHIPLPEFHEAAQNESAYFVGTRKEKACAPEINTGLAAAMLEAGDVMGVFVGHDHVNDYVVDWRGILLGYGRFTGGATVYHDIPEGNGARIIELTEDSRTIKTWIRIKGGKVINEVNYPADAQ